MLCYVCVHNICEYLANCSTLKHLRWLMLHIHVVMPIHSQNVCDKHAFTNFLWVCCKLLSIENIEMPQHSHGCSDSNIFTTHLQWTTLYKQFASWCQSQFVNKIQSQMIVKMNFKEGTKFCFANSLWILMNHKICKCKSLALLQTYCKHFENVHMQRWRTWNIQCVLICKWDFLECLFFVVCKPCRFANRAFSVVLFWGSNLIRRAKLFIWSLEAWTWGWLLPSLSRAKGK